MENSQDGDATEAAMAASNDGERDATHVGGTSVSNHQLFMEVKAQQFTQNIGELHIWLLKKKGIDSSHLDDKDNAKLKNFLVNFSKKCGKKWKASKGQKKSFEKAHICWLKEEVEVPLLGLKRKRSSGAGPGRRSMPFDDLEPRGKDIQAKKL